ncbi:hypothetical protein [Chryseobacterium indoltheticum]|uniref:hypothetical protein n=1 Tax=Chryseobacterium indoltheticum TaxID=254 RepID=UPI001914CC69|nr:hypothetical protein [Chryseobacterium indoltheticum]QQQ29003.1 hypothetical protein JJL46_03030 [Chryseobacterium indoltheticum]
MQKILKTFFVFSLLLIFLSNVSGISVCLEHARHSVTKTADKKESKGEKSKTISQDDECQCDLHLHMNASLLPDIQDLDIVFNTENKSEMPQSKAKTYRCLLDYFSSRAPPCLS